VRVMRALIIGPPDTPYEFGFFEVSEIRRAIAIDIPDHELVRDQVWQRYRPDLDLFVLDDDFLTFTKTIPRNHLL
jgi:hypothetical protein